MLSDELKSINAVLGKLVVKVDPDTADTLRLCAHNLEAAANEAEVMENNFYPLVENRIKETA